MTSTTDRARLIGFVAASGVRRVLARISGIFAGGLPFDGRAPARLLIAPHDLRTADPTVAGDIYRGRFSLCGTAIEIGGTSPFHLPPPSRAWQEELLSFSWLRHLHAADDAVSRVHARALIADWIATYGSVHPVGWQPHVLARRIIAWLAHSPLYLANAEPDFYRAVMRSLGRQLRYLARHVSVAPDGVPRLTAHIALAYATLCISGLERLQARAVRQLAQELERQVLPDGGHISRDPGAVLELLLDLLPLRQTFLSRDVAPPQALLGAIDRMMPMVRFFRHSDGSFGLFNGMGRTPIGDISAVLAYDDSRGRPGDQAPHSGYQRLEAGPTVVLMDAGPPPPTSVSHRAHAGCLSIEVSTGKDRIITNCGNSSTLRDEWRQAARATAAHSTVVVADASSCRYIAGGPLARIFGTPVIAGPRDVQAERSDHDGSIVVEAEHDGYRRLGLIHHRRISIAGDGLEIEGLDRLTRSSALFSRTRPFAIRFHLHPAVRPQPAQDARTLLLALPGGGAWRFSVFGASLRLEESVYLVDPKGARRTSQIVISGQCANEALIRWSLKRDTGVPRVREVREGEREERVLPQAIDPTGAAAEPAGTGAEAEASPPESRERVEPADQAPEPAAAPDDPPPRSAARREPTLGRRGPRRAPPLPPLRGPASRIGSGGGRSPGSGDPDATGGGAEPSQSPGRIEPRLSVTRKPEGDDPEAPDRESGGAEDEPDKT